VYAFLVSLVQPYFLVLVLLGVALWRLTRAARPGWRRGLLLWSPYVALVILSCPLTAYYALGSLEWSNPPLRDRPEDVQAIVVLSCGVLSPDDIRPDPELDLVGRARTELGAHYYHQGRPIPILVSGGPLRKDIVVEAVADLMHDLLVKLQVPEKDILVEKRSMTTYENAVESAALLKERGLTRILLVTDAGHMPRAAACFRKQGLDVVCAGCYYQATTWKLTWYFVQPSVESLMRFQEAAHEWLGLLWYWGCGRI
jgi:uncharacterized SAM-binding protein YcdF (DUF218 family)